MYINKQYNHYYSQDVKPEARSPLPLQHLPGCFLSLWVSLDLEFHLRGILQTRSLRGILLFIVFCVWFLWIFI